MALRHSKVRKERAQRGGGGREGIRGDGRDGPNDGDLARGPNGGQDSSGKGGHGHNKGGAAGGAAGSGSANVVDNGAVMAMAMEVDTGEERGPDAAFGQENGGAGGGQAGAGATAGAVGAVNGDGSMRRDGDEMGFKGCGEIPDGDVAVLNNHHSEVRYVASDICSGYHMRTHLGLFLGVEVGAFKASLSRCPVKRRNPLLCREYDCSAATANRHMAPSCVRIGRVQTLYAISIAALQQYSRSR